MIRASLLINSNRCRNKYPVPPVHKISEYSSQERLIYSRLNPSINDTYEVVTKNHFHYMKNNVSIKEYNDIISNYPFTEQKSYLQYMTQLVPKYVKEMELLHNNSNLFSQNQNHNQSPQHLNESPIHSQNRTYTVMSFSSTSTTPPPTTTTINNNSEQNMSNNSSYNSGSGSGNNTEVEQLNQIL